MLKIIKYFALAAAAAAALAVCYGYWYVQDRIVPFPEGQQELVLKVHKGDTTRIIVREMQSEGLDVHPDISALAFKLLDADKNIHVGRYLIPKGWTLNEIIAHLKSGKVIMSKITFIEGTETKKIVDKVNSDTNLEQNSEPITMENVMKVVGAPENTHPEGQFAPDTFVFAAGSSANSILKQSYNEQQKRLKKVWNSRDPSIAIKNPYELLILASIIEKETGHPEDRNLVASVFNNRLKKNMLLQTDPTVIYGTKDYQGKILRSHLAADHPYNTYIHPGLPPTPIANPSLASLEAAAHPADTKYLYFVAKGEGKSYFSQTLREHNAAVQKYLRSKGK